jgi:lipid-A-disaccharide synthase
MEPLLTTKYISLVNLLADRAVFPEYPSERCEAEKASADILHWLNQPEAHASVVQELKQLRERVANPGACKRAARYIRDALTSTDHAPSRLPLKVSA